MTYLVLLIGVALILAAGPQLALALYTSKISIGGVVAPITRKDQPLAYWTTIGWSLLTVLAGLALIIRGALCFPEALQWRPSAFGELGLPQCGHSVSREAAPT